MQGSYAKGQVHMQRAKVVKHFKMEKHGLTLVMLTLWIGQIKIKYNEFSGHFYPK